MIRFRTRSGSRYVWDGEVLTRLSERPPIGKPLDPRPHPAALLGKIRVGYTARFVIGDDVLVTSPVTAIEDEEALP